MAQPLHGGHTSLGKVLRISYLRSYYDMGFVKPGISWVEGKYYLPPLPIRTGRAPLGSSGSRQIYLLM
jgi:hypothetical protein